MDIATIVPAARTVEINHPATDKPIGLRFTILSVLDDRMANVRRQLMDKALARSQKGKALTAIDVEGNEINMLCEAITGWEWGEAEDGEPCTIDGEQPEFTKRTLAEVLRRFKWMRDQLSEAMDEEKSFFHA